jgi:prephenate dehydratase
MGLMGAKSDHLRVSFQGERGAFSEEAVFVLLGKSAEPCPCPTFESAFAALEKEDVDYALVPLENTLAGSIHRTYDLLLDSKFHIVGEVIIPVVHNLIGCPGATLANVKVVQSHPVALFQCLQFFENHPGIQRKTAEDTAGSVREVMERGDPTVAAIAGRRAAELYGGSILLEHLEDDPENYTRFVLLSSAPNQPEGANKLSLAVKVKHQPGALHSALGIFADRKINLCKIESRPLKGSPWQYSFYLDLEVSSKAQMNDALDQLRETAADLRVLGWYKSAASSSN